jgi:hypothetical protein
MTSTASDSQNKRRLYQLCLFILSLLCHVRAWNLDLKRYEVSLPTFQKSFATLSSSRLYAKEKNNVLKDEGDDNFLRLL